MLLLYIFGVLSSLTRLQNLTSNISLLLKNNKETVHEQMKLVVKCEDKEVLEKLKSTFLIFNTMIEEAVSRYIVFFFPYVKLFKYNYKDTIWLGGLEEKMKQIHSNLQIFDISNIDIPNEEDTMLTEIKSNFKKAKTKVINRIPAFKKSENLKFTNEFKIFYKKLHGLTQDILNTSKDITNEKITFRIRLTLYKNITNSIYTILNYYIKDFTSVIEHFEKNLN